MEVKKKKMTLDMEKKQNNALKHWITQKVSALVLVPLLFWFLFIFKDFVYKDYNNKILWFQDIKNSSLLALFLLVALFHLRLGLTVVVEDYIHNIKIKNMLLSSVSILCLLLSVFTVIVVLNLFMSNNV
ncbi:MAG: hypothetical protein CFH34_00522 [Alphaproteobacteria bacterium MarineAlpha9_Bin4]|mgnify:CR=1 FL=1|nr:MAG: hypothetical protein CFH34_00522 [Alphaproteobacteria bacterium MarineAlpha9_Bin4]|tara:strand:- start:371 stop:757 length:387 start_codon:yes stop_codon:yes gene_type:complete